MGNKLIEEGGVGRIHRRWQKTCPDRREYSGSGETRVRPEWAGQRTDEVPLIGIRAVGNGRGRGFWPCSRRWRGAREDKKLEQSEELSSPALNCVPAARSATASD